ncbi:MAG: ABC transporter substrate-binding protein [Bacteroidetes bacterium]|nr:ABC transporter substrate-binding protein [Bacteroidota bacterium]
MPAMIKTNVSAVAYHNTRPFLFGLKRSPLAQQLDIQLDIPSEGARKLRAGEVSLALVPVGVLHNVPQARIIADWGIGCDGPVRTVCLYAEKPLEELQQIWMDYHSVTSVRLLTLLLRDYWKVSPERMPALPGFRGKIGGTTGGLVIGDRAIGLEHKFEYVYDLGQAWKDWTGLPFVFAVWASTKTLDPAFAQAFQRALADGIAHLPEVAAQAEMQDPGLKTQVAGFSLLDYYQHNISYNMDEAKREGLGRFLQLIGNRPARWESPASLAEHPQN